MSTSHIEENNVMRVTRENNLRYLRHYSENIVVSCTMISRSPSSSPAIFLRIEPPPIVVGQI